MRKRFAIIIVMATLTLAIGSLPAYAQGDKDSKKTVAQSAQMRPNNMPLPPRMAFNMISGKIEKTDMSDPANVKIDVKNEADGKVHTVTLTSNTNITKATDASELKIGDTVRVMARASEGKEIAMGVMFGKLKPIPVFRPMAQAKRTSMKQPVLPPAANEKSKQ